MGTFSTGGIAAEMAKFDRIAKNADKAIGKAVKAGGKALAQRLSESAPVYAGPHHDVTPGALRDSIKAGTVKYNAGDGWHCKVAPQGDDHGEPLAKIGNIVEYGHSDTPAHPWFMPTVEQASGEVVNVMRETFQAENRKGL